MNLTRPQRLIYDMEKFSGGSISVICGSMLVKGDKDIFELKKAVNELYRLNDALRICVRETDSGVEQCVYEYAERDVEVLSFANRTELELFANSYAKIALDISGMLCEMKIILLPDCFGVLVKLHHLIGDAWTLSLLGSQLNAILNGETPEAYSYIDYIESESTYLKSKRYGNDRDFFLEQFQKCDEVVYINEKQNKTFDSRRKTFVIDVDKAKIINDYITSNKTSSFVLFMVALAIYINRIKMNVEKFYIGTAVLNRIGNKEKNTAGMFINTVPMLIELDNTADFKTNLLSIADIAFSVFRHQKYNYDDVLNSIRKEYNFTEKLYDVMLSYQNAAIISGSNTDSTWYHCGMQSESLQIHIDDRDNEGIFRVHYDYLIDKFTENEIERMHQHICNLLFDAISDDTKKLYELNILSADEKQKLLYDFNNTDTDYPRDKCVHQLFEEQVAKTSNKIAVIACDKTLTYAELNEQANRIAYSLIEKGVGVGNIVAIKLSRKSYLISAILGVLKSGGTYLPIDPNYPQDRIDYMMADSKAKFLITDDNIQELLQSENSSNPNICVDSKDLFCCIYTSGSTGQPKAVMLSHNNFCNYFSKHMYIDHVLKCETTLSISNVVFDMFINEVFSALLFGLKLVLADETEISEPKKLATLIQDHNVQSIICTPIKFSIYLTDNQFKSALSNVKALTFGGEVLTEELCNNISDCSDATIINGYGPTETTIVSSYGKIEDK